LNKILIILVISIAPSLLTGQTLGSRETALVFSGGGARGSYEIGVWKALSDLNFNIGGVYGTSVGAINGAAISSAEYTKIRDLWFETSYLSVMNISPEAEALLSGEYKELSLKDYMNVIKDFRSSGGIDVSPLKNYLAEVISEEDVRKSHIDFGLVLYSVSDMKPQMLYIDQIPQGELIDYILGSANFPLFQRQKIEGNIMIDGGVYSNVPIDMAIGKGFKNIIIVDIGFSTPVDIANTIKLKSDNSVNLTYIIPGEHYGSILNFDQQKSKKYLLAGYLDTMKKYNYLAGSKFYFYGSGDIIKTMFDSLTEIQKNKALSILGINKESRVIELFYDMVIKTEAAENRSIRILENLATITNINPIAVYTQQDLLELILNRIDSSKANLPLIEIIRNIQYGKTIDFLKYLSANSNITTEIPDGYNNFFTKFDTLLE
jgi:NTE family protein